MKRTILILLMLASLAFLSGCAAYKRNVYYTIDNWAVRENAVPRYYAVYDVFFVHPSMFKNQEETYLNWSKKYCENYTIADFITDYVKSQTVHIFDTEENKRLKEHYSSTSTNIEMGRKVRIFAPLVHQVEHGKYLESLRDGSYAKKDSLVQAGIKDTQKALEFYLKNYHKKGRPYIIVGQGQGAVDAYEAMRRCRKVKPEDGFVAAYLIGLPHTSMEKINKDFNRRGISAGVNEYDTSVILSWNARGRHLEHSLLTDEESYAINPVHWSIDGTVSTKSMDLGTSFYDFHADLENRKNEHDEKSDPVVGRNNLTETYVDRGVLIFNEEDVLHEFSPAILDENELHCHLFSLFNKNIVVNAERRVVQYIYKRLWHKDTVAVKEKY